jgi:uncharacterized Zn-binding protein involved in type VI secretion
MSGAAFANGDSAVVCTDGIQGTVCATSPTRWNWNVGSTQQTASTSNSKVFVEGKAIAVEGDTMAPHPDGFPCTLSPINHEPTASVCAANIKIGGKFAMRIGSKFNKGTVFDHTISTGSSKVFLGGPDVSV